MAEKEGQQTPPPKKKKKGGHPAHHGGAWKVAFADFMTSMFALFLVLWVIATSSSSQKAAIASYFRNPTLFAPGSNRPVVLQPNTEGGGQDDQDGSSKTSDGNMTDKNGVTEQEKMDELKKELGNDSLLKELGTQFKVEMTEQGLKIEMNEAGSTGVFELGSSKLTPAMNRQLEHLSNLLGQGSNKLVIAGYTDRYKYSNGYSNSQLSADRANAVRERLIASGVDTSRVEAVVGYGDHELANPSNPYSPENRRVSLLVLKDNGHFSIGSK